MIQGPAADGVTVMRLSGGILAFVLLAGPVVAQQPAPTLEQVLLRLGDYVSSYGEKASVVVAVERYTQSVSVAGTAAPLRPRQLEAEFAIVRVSGGGWTGFRDVVAVDGEPVQDRKDRLVSLLTDTSADVNEVIRIANESARFNVGPVSRNFNVPTAAMFFFQPADHARFTFTRKGTRTIEGVPTWEIAFKETRSPTLIMTRAGQDVPMEGSLWVNPADGTVIQTRLRLRDFADELAAVEGAGPAQRPTGNPNVPRGGRDAFARADSPPTVTLRRVESLADIEVSYRRPPGIDLWLPATMVEIYDGPIVLKARPLGARATTRASYSDFKQFNTSIKIVPQ